MQAPGSLSDSQILTLENCYQFLLSLRPLLVSLNAQGELDSTILLAELLAQRLPAEFPELDRIKKLLGGQR